MNKLGLKATYLKLLSICAEAGCHNACLKICEVVSGEQQVAEGEPPPTATPLNGQQASHVLQAPGGQGANAPGPNALGGWPASIPPQPHAQVGYSGYPGQPAGYPLQPQMGYPPNFPYGGQPQFIPDGQGGYVVYYSAQPPGGFPQNHVVHTNPPSLGIIKSKYHILQTNDALFLYRASSNPIHCPANCHYSTSKLRRRHQRAMTVVDCIVMIQVPQSQGHAGAATVSASATPIAGMCCS